MQARRALTDLMGHFVFKRNLRQGEIFAPVHGPTVVW
jgi:hypothetical protein